MPAILLTSVTWWAGAMPANILALRELREWTVKHTDSTLH